MAKKLTRLVAFVLLLKVALSGTTERVQAQTPSALYPAAAPLNDYLFPTEASEIELARSAGPAVIAGTDIRPQ
jgi:hypothetical protein